MLNAIPPRNAPPLLPTQFTTLGIASRNVHVDCANPHCGSGWTAAFKDRRRPRFEAGWACSKSCISALVSSAIRRELHQAGDADSQQHHHRVPLGLILFAKGWITHAQLQLARDAQQHDEPSLIGQWFVERCGIPQDRIARALGTQWGCPVLTMDDFDPRTMALVMPNLLLEASGVVPIRIARDRILYLGSADQPDPAAALAIQRISGLKVVTGLIDASQQEYARREVLTHASVDATLQHADDPDSLIRAVTSAIVKAQPRASSLVRLHQLFWLRMWLESGAMSFPSGGFPRTREDVVDCVFTLGSER